MPFKEYIYSVLIVSASESLNHSLLAFLPTKDYSPIDIVKSISFAQQKMSERSYDLVIVNTPLPDDFGRKFAIDVSTNTHSVVVMLVKSDIYDETYAKISEHGVLALRKPASTVVVNYALDWMRSTRERLRKQEKKALYLEDKMAEIRIVNRAKWSLIEYCHMTEADAHRYIEKKAMDRCVTRKEIAEEILQIYKS